VVIVRKIKSELLIKPPASRMLKAGRIILSPGEEVGEHITEKREELIIVLKGTATLIKETEILKLKEHETHYIKEGIKHNIKNNSGKELEYIYVVSMLQ
jgi:mannose-6-phosphate isomerase-like protein (cupin superfamily)